MLYREEWYEQVCDDVQLTYEEALQQANSLICHREESDFQGKKILSKDLEDKEENGVCVLSAKYSCMEDIGIKEQMELN